MLFLISRFLQKLSETDNVEVIQNLIFKSYGLVLMNTQIFLDLNATARERLLDIHRRISFEKYLMDSKYEGVKSCVNNLIRCDFLSMVSNFFRAIRIGDMSNLQQIIELDQMKCIMSMRDYSGRTCLHLSVLYSRLQITKWFSF